MKKFTKFLSLFCVAAVALMLAACGKTPATTKAPATQAPATQAPATQAPATQAPATTAAPTTAAPVTTVAPTTQTPVVPFENINLVDYCYNAFTMAKTGANEWAYIGLNPEDVELTGVTALKVTVKGKDGGQLLFKVGDSKECYVNTNGTLQTETFDLTTFEFNPDKMPLIVFSELGSAGTGDSYLVLEAKFVYGDTEYDMISNADLPASGAAGDYNFQRLYADMKTGDDQWECRVLRVDGDFSLVNHLKVVVNGGANEKIMFKINDTVEKSLTLDANGTGTIDSDFSFEWNHSKGAMVVFPNFLEDKTGHPFLMSEITLSVAQAPTDEPLTTADLVAANWNAVQITKNVNDAWAAVVLNLNNPDYTGLQTLQVTLIGPEGGKVLLKVNDSVEKWLTTTGALQKENIDISDVTFDASKAAMAIFVDAGEDATNTPYSFAYLMYVGETKSYNLLTQTNLPDDGQNGSFMINRFYYEIKASNDPWECRTLKMEGDLSKLNHFKGTVYGTEGETFTFKVNDQYEFNVTIGADGKATVEGDFNITWNQAKAAMVVFPNLNHDATGHPFLVTEMVLTAVEAD